MADALLEDLDATTLELLQEVAARLELDEGRRDFEAIFVDGKLVDLHFHGRRRVDELRCSCRKGAWNPSCPIHPATQPNTVG